MLWDRLKIRPGTRPLVQGVEEWSARSPVAASGRLVANALDAALRPIAQRHPWQLAIGVFALSGLFVWRRPWRKLLSPALLMAVLPPLFSVFAGNAPRPAWLSLASALLNRRRPAQRV